MIQKIVFPIILIAALTSCADDGTDGEVSAADSLNYMEFYGNTQGTTFAVICNDDIDITTEEIETILDDFDLALSSYIPNSTISKLNAAGAGVFEFRDSGNYFRRCYDISKRVFNLSNGRFDPTVFPLVDAWGFFGNEQKDIPDSARVDFLRALSGFELAGHFNYLGSSDSIATDSTIYKIQKITPNSQLGFDAVAQGLAVDILAECLESKGARNYFVEIGGEIRVKGVNTEGELWSIGIDKPIENSTTETREIQKIVKLDDRSIATSGSYRRFYEKDGLKYSHTIDPRSGYPVQHSLLSTSVIADDCAMADAMATTFMVMGADSTMAFVKEHPELGLDVYLIFINEKGLMETYYTAAFKDSGGD
ncbi:FAD:protein FMN transferase [bacterium AH-315-C20]|nr:FAD:protein FMN transferase [bacterium AH-315-C20]